jgi:hypothetical protein
LWAYELPKALDKTPPEMTMPQVWGMVQGPAFLTSILGSFDDCLGPIIDKCQDRA